MSGVAKDDINPTSPPDETTPVTSETETVAQDVQSKDDGEQRSRRVAPHLRVVDEEFTPPAGEELHQRIGDAIRAARENSGFTLEQVSRETRVHLSHLRAIEDMTPGLLGAPVYAKGYIKSYARFLGMDEQETLDRFLSECAAILKDPEKPEIAPPATSKARKLPVAAPVLGLLVVGLIGGGAAILLSNGSKAPVVTAETPAAVTGVGPIAEPVAPQLRIVALKRAMLEVRSAKGDKYVHRYYNPGESFIVRVGAGFTVTAEDGAAFEWRMGDQSLGLLQAEGGPVYSQSVDMAAQRQPVAPPSPPVVPSESEANAVVAAPGSSAASAGAAPAPANPAPVTPPKPRPKPVTPPVAAAPPPAEPVVTPPPARDPALDAYPDQVPTTTGQ